MAYSDVVLADSPTLFWRLNETTPGTGSAADSSGSGNNGTYVASPTSIRGLLRSDSDTAVTFNGTSQWVTSSYNPFQTASNRTFECWVKRTDTTSNDVMIGGSQPSTQPFLTINLTSDTVQFNTSAAAGGQTWTNAVKAGQPTHVLLTWTGGTLTSELWINSVSQGTKVHSTDFDATPGNFNVGKRSTASDPYLGVVDEVAVYTSVLSSARIRAHYVAGVDVPLPVGVPMMPMLKRMRPLFSPVWPFPVPNVEVVTPAVAAFYLDRLSVTLQAMNRSSNW